MKAVYNYMACLRSEDIAWKQGCNRRHI